MSTDAFAPFVKLENESYIDVAPTSARFVKNDGYLLLVWRKFRRSVMGMIGLTLVILLILTAICRECLLINAEFDKFY